MDGNRLPLALCWKDGIFPWSDKPLHVRYGSGTFGAAILVN